mmetsp:Transcript_23494/g.61793  ORF Transcript_23494/g.61793 Transcript_23494/m.61793 type:complete len:323 (-) Transcript_23494:3-971(-)
MQVSERKTIGSACYRQAASELHLTQLTQPLHLVLVGDRQKLFPLGLNSSFATPIRVDETQQFLRHGQRHIRNRDLVPAGLSRSVREHCPENRRPKGEDLAMARQALPLDDQGRAATLLCALQCGQHVALQALRWRPPSARGRSQDVRRLVRSDRELYSNDDPIAHLQTSALVIEAGLWDERRETTIIDDIFGVDEAEALLSQDRHHKVRFSSELVDDTNRVTRAHSLVSTAVVQVQRHVPGELLLAAKRIYAQAPPMTRALNVGAVDGWRHAWPVLDDPLKTTAGRPDARYDLGHRVVARRRTPRRHPEPENQVNGPLGLQA